MNVVLGVQELIAVATVAHRVLMTLAWSFQIRGKLFRLDNMAIGQLVGLTTARVESVERSKDVALANMWVHFILNIDIVGNSHYLPVIRCLRAVADPVELAKVELLAGAVDSLPTINRAGTAALLSPIDSPGKLSCAVLANVHGINSDSIE